MIRQHALPPSSKTHWFARHMLAVVGVVCSLEGCDLWSESGREPSSTSVPTSAPVPAPIPSSSALPKELAVAPAADAGTDGGTAAQAELPPHPGPWFVVTSLAASIYRQPKFDRKAHLGYARSGAKLPVKEGAVSREECSGGWYAVVDGGYVCGNQGSVDEKNPELRFTMKQPDWDAVLPYRYARNSKHGTPLYRSIPSREQMLEYEPYLRESSKSSSDAGDAGAPKASPDTEPAAGDSGGGAARRLRGKLDEALSDAGFGVELGESTDATSGTPWWQKENAQDTLHEVTLDQLEAEADGILAKRMVKGFYIAIDKTFRWNGRTWYKTTKGLVAPQDRFGYAEGSTFQGTALGTEHQLPLAWVHGWRKSTSLYRIDTEKQTLKTEGSVEKFALLDLTGRTVDIRGRVYRETKAGTWVRAAHVRVTEPGPAPEGVGPQERWIDINISQQTLVVYEGTTPLYATLLSSGRASNIKTKDHRTPIGEWRVREKHVTTTMDGDGSAAGDLPYSIEDVPYVLYYYRSYALHGAFWHRNYGVEMSHGCVNLAPLDAKWVFQHVGPKLPSGWHGVWATEENPGARVVVHEGTRTPDGSD